MPPRSRPGASSTENQPKIVPARASLPACPPFPPPPPPRTAAVVEGSHSNATSTIAQSPSVAEASFSLEQLPSTQAELPKHIISTSDSNVADSAPTPLREKLDISEFNDKYNPMKTNTRHLDRLPWPIPNNFATKFDPDAFLLHGDLVDVTESLVGQNRRRAFQAALEKKHIHVFKASLG